MDQRFAYYCGARIESWASRLGRGAPRRPATICLTSAVMLACASLFCGCTNSALRSQSPDEFEAESEVKTKLVGDYARPYGNGFVKVENVALVTNLPEGMGEDPPPSPQRAILIREMQTRGVHNPNQVLASGRVAMVLVKGLLPPGVQKGEKFDLEVQVPTRSNVASLRGGWLMETRLTELAVMGNEIHDGHLLALGEGSVLVDPAADGEGERGALVRGRVLGGGTALKSRSIGLVISPDERSISLSSQIGTAVNRRFHSSSHGIQKGLATPKTDEFIELQIHPRYKDNVGRYVKAVLATPLSEQPSEQQARLAILERQLLEPITAASAAIRLEAIGKPAVRVLERGVASDLVESKFYAAEALAYLDEPSAAKPLGQIARDEPAFRAYALAALSAMEESAALDELRDLLSATSAETRYGAFRAIWAKHPGDPAVRGELLGGKFSYHLVRSDGPPMVHVTRSFRPEIVLFGDGQRLEPPLVLDAGKSIMINSRGGETVTVSKFAVGQPDQKRVVSTRLDDVIRAIVDLGGTYPEVVQVLQQAKSTKALPSRFEVDAIPESNRAYERANGADDNDEAPSEPAIEVATPLSALFKRAAWMR